MVVPASLLFIDNFLVFFGISTMQSFKQCSVVQCILFQTQLADFSNLTFRTPKRGQHLPLSIVLKTIRNVDTTPVLPRANNLTNEILYRWLYPQVYYLFIVSTCFKTWLKCQPFTQCVSLATHLQHR